MPWLLRTDIGDGYGLYASLVFINVPLFVWSRDVTCDVTRDLTRDKQMAVQTKSIRGVPTHVIELPASRIHHGLPPTVLVVPGSPGAGHFYLPFAQRLQELFQRQTNIAVVSHAGHSPGWYRTGREFDMQGDATTEDDRRWFSLEDQVQHKMAYLEESVSPCSQLIIIGHSIGCYVVLQMLKQIHPDRVKKVFLLFPTMERMAESKNGQRFYPYYFGKLKMVLVFIAGLLSIILPHVVQRMVLGLFLRKIDPSIRSHFVEGGMNVISARSLYNILSMAHQELQEVIQLEASMLERHGHKVVLYYGVKDHWVPDDVYAITKERFPLCDVVLCDRSCKHAFVKRVADYLHIAEFVHSRVEVW